MWSLFTHVHVHVIQVNRPFGQLWPANEVRASPTRTVAAAMRVFLICTRFSSALECCSAITAAFSLFQSRRGRVSPSLFSHSFPLRKRWLLYIRQVDWSHFRVPISASTVVLSIATKMVSAPQIRSILQGGRQVSSTMLHVMWGRGTILVAIESTRDCN